MPGMFDTPVILNLHLLLWDSYIAANDARPPLQWKAERAAAVTHLALLGVKIQETAFWVYLLKIRYE